MVDLTEKRLNLFKKVNFYLNDSIKPQIRKELSAILIKGGATQCSKPLDENSTSTSNSNSSSRRFDELQITHFITDSLDFPEYNVLNSLNLNQVPNYLDREDANQILKVAIVTPFWITRSWDCARIMAPRFYSADKSLIFSGFCFCSSDLPELDTKTIQLAVMSMGGDWRDELTKEVTHLFVLAAKGVKYEMALKAGPKLGMIILLPQWVEECLTVQQLLPVDLYTFPEPHLFQLREWNSETSFEERLASWTKGRTLEDPPSFALSESLTSKLLQWGSNQSRRSNDIYQRTAIVQCEKPVVEQLTGSMSNNRLNLPVPLPLISTATSSATITNNSKQNSNGIWPQPINLPPPTPDQFFSERIVYLASDLALKPGMEFALKVRIENAGGKCWSWGVDGTHLGKTGGQWERRRIAEVEMKKANTVVTNTREGWEYWHAYSQDKTIGNLAWMYHILSQSKLDSPLDRLIHYPLPPTEIEKFKDVTITITNYAGPARDYIRALIQSLGAKFDGAMSRHTNYVITASEYGSKVKHAKSWEIPCINHLWLESCLLEWKLISPHQHSKFSAAICPGLNFMSILGNTNLPRGAIEKWANEDENVKAKERAMEPIVGGEDVSGEIENKEGFDDLDPLDENDDSEESRKKDQVTYDDDDIVMKEVQVENQDEEKQAAEIQAEVEIIVNAVQEDLMEEDEDENEAVEALIVTKKKVVEKKIIEKKVVEKKVIEKKVVEKKVVEKKKLVPVIQIDNDPVPSSSSKKQKQIPSTSMNTPKTITTNRSNRKRSASTSSSSSSVVSPEKEVHGDVGTSNILPIGGRKRGAAVAAAANLSIQMTDVIKFAKEQTSGKKRKKESHGGVSGISSSARKARGEDDDEDERGEDEKVSRKKGKSKATKNDSSDESEVDTVIAVKKNSKGKESKLKTVISKSGVGAVGGETQDGVISSFDNPPRAKPAKVKESIGEVIRVLSTGLNLEEGSVEMKKFLKLGAKWTNHPAEVTHLVVKGILRTEKFLISLAFQPHIVTKEWITSSIKAGKILDATRYAVKDKAKEAEMGVTLITIMNRIKTEGKFFEGVTIYLTPKIVPEVNVLRRIIQAHGGIASTSPLSTPSIRTALLEKPHHNYIISCEADRKHWEKLTSKDRLPVFSVAAILDGVLKQDKAIWNEDGGCRIDPRGDL